VGKFVKGLLWYEPGSKNVKGKRFYHHGQEPGKWRQSPVVTYKITFDEGKNCPLGLKIPFTRNYHQPTRKM